MSRNAQRSDYWFPAGQVERFRGRGYAWRQGYSRVSGVVATTYPWMTKAEARAHSLANDRRAVFCKSQHEAEALFEQSL